MRLKICPICVSALALGMIMIFAGCLPSKTTSGPLPEPATNVSLSGAESNLDRLTDKRISRVAASVVVAEGAVSKDEPSESDLAVAKAELKIARAMTGEPSKADLDYANARAEKMLASSPEDAKKIIAQGIITAENLKKEIENANSRYEQEKAKKQAEFDAKLKEKEIEIKARQMELEQERIARDMQKWTLAGIGMFTIGILLTILAPMPVLKKLGMALTLSGIICGSFPIIGNEPWFKYAIGGTILTLVIGLLVKMFLFKPKCAVDNTSKDTSSDSSGPSNDNTN